MIALAVIAGSPLLVQCGSDDDPQTVDPNKPPEPGQIGAACSTANDCTNARCLTDPSFVGGYCFETCSQDGKCSAEGAKCVGYLGYKWCLDACPDDKACRQGYICQYGVCVPPCTSDRVCQGEDTCRDKRCKPPCTKDSECSTGQRCQDGDCLPPCKVEDDCLPGFRCDAGNGKCIAKPGKRMGESCGANSQCSTSYCLPTRKVCSIRCKGTGDCPKKYVCGLEKLDRDRNGRFDGAEADCVPVKGDVPAGGACANDDACKSGHCFYGFCMEGCDADGNCEKTDRCVSVNLLVGGAVAPYRGCLPKVGTSHNFDLGTVKTGGAVGVDVPAHATSFILTTSVAPWNEAAIVGEAKEPKGTVIAKPVDQCNYFSQPIRYLYGEQVSTLFVPNTPTFKLTPGLHSFVFTATKPDLDIRVRVSMKLGQATKGTLNINWYFLNLGGTCIKGATLNAASAKAGHAWFKAMRDEVAKTFAQAKVALGQQTFTDIKDPSLDVVDFGGSPDDMQKLMAKSSGTSAAINVFLVREIKGSSAGGGLFVTLGISGGIPGPPGLHGTGKSGVLLSAQTACGKSSAGLALAHELGHYLGLFHNQENFNNPGFDAATKKVLCPCPCPNNMICQRDFGASWCRGIDPLPDTQFKQTNLMYWAAHGGEDFTGGTLTPDQQRVILNNPIVGH